MPTEVEQVRLPDRLASYFIEYSRDKHGISGGSAYVLTAPEEVYDEIDELIEDSSVFDTDGQRACITAVGDMYEDDQGRFDYDALLEDIEETIEYGEEQESDK